MSACLSVCPCVCVFTFEVPFKRLFAPTSQSRVSNIFKESESLGKVMEMSGLMFEHFCLKMVQNRRAKKVFFANFALQNMVKTTLSDGLETSGQRVYC